MPIVKPLQLANVLIERAAFGKGLKSPLEQSKYTGDFVRLEEADNVRQCVLDLISTRVGERVMNEDLGSEFPPLLFENASGLVDILPVHAREVITRFEPRVRDVTARAQQFGSVATGFGVNVFIAYTLRSIGRRDNLVYPFYLEPPEGGVTGDQ